MESKKNLKSFRTLKPKGLNMIAKITPKSLNMIAKIVQKVHLGLTISDAFKYKYSTKVLCESNIYSFLKQMRRTKTGRVHGTYVISLPQLCYIENYKKHIYKIRSTGGKT